MTAAIQECVMDPCLPMQALVSRVGDEDTKGVMSSGFLFQGAAGNGQGVPICPGR